MTAALYYERYFWDATLEVVWKFLFLSAMMKIVVTTTLRDKIKGDRFFVRMFRNADVEREYRGKYEEGAWEFELYDGENMVLRCERVKLAAKDTFLRRQAYTIFYESEELCKVNKGFFNRTIIWD